MTITRLRQLLPWYHKKPGGIDSLESISGLLKRLQIWALFSTAKSGSVSNKGYSKSRLFLPPDRCECEEPDRTSGPSGQLQYKVLQKRHA
jgi:hypothetical protein